MSAPDLVEEVVPLEGRELAVLRPRDSEALIDEETFADDERMPYWAELWPSGVALARMVWASPRRGRRVLELGCGGLALPSIAAALTGARVTATDWAREALDLAAENAARNGATIAVEEVAWGEADALVARAPWDLVLAADVLYERRNVDPLLALLPRLGAEVWLADPGRAPLEEFLSGATAEWDVEERRDHGGAPSVTVFRMRVKESTTAS